MNLNLKNKRALITGAGRGIGESVALHLAKEGVKVAIISRTQKDLDVLIKKVGGKKKGNFAVSIDLTKEHAPEKAVKLVRKEFGEPDIVVNNLGSTLNIKDPYCPISDWRKLWRINLEVAIEINNLLIPSMQKAKWGRIVHIASIAGLENQGPVPYCTMKAAVIAYTRSMGRVVAKDGIVITSVLPGPIFARDGYWDITSKNNPEHVKKYLSDRVAIGRFGKPEEIGSVVTFLCSEKASFFTGSAVLVDGGQGRCFQT